MFFLLIQERKIRSGFTIQKDIILLRTALIKNPWQTGSEKWTNVKEIVQKAYNHEVSVRGLKTRVSLLLKQYRSQQLQCKTGTEEEKSFRGRLLESIDLIVVEESSAINYMYSADQDEFSDSEEAIDNSDTSNTSLAIVSNSDDTQHENTVDLTQPTSPDVLNESNQGVTADSVEISAKNKAKNIRKQRLAERKKADAERDELLELADEPSNRTKKARLSVEEEMIVKRQEHEMKMETERLEIDKRRENRLQEEAQRRDEFNMSQLVVQQTMLNMVSKLIEHQMR